MNEMPNMTKISADRWNMLILDDYMPVHSCAEKNGMFNAWFYFVHVHMILALVFLGFPRFAGELY